MSSPGPLLTRLGGVDALSWNPVREAEGAAGDRRVDNFGDLLGPVIVERLAGPWALRRPDRSGPAPVLLSVGSVLHFAPYHAVVWGSGVNFKVAEPVPATVATLDIRAVRGPFTARTLAAAGAVVPEVFGDPALLLPRLLPELHSWTRLRGADVLVVPNFNDFAEAAPVAQALGAEVLNPRAPLGHVLQTIAQSGFVVGSSLHGVAVADALGIPARFVASPAEHPLKYRDYLAGTGRPLTRIAPDLVTAISWGGHAGPRVDLDALVEAFPHDMWGGERVTPPAAHRPRASVATGWSAVMASAPPNLSVGEATALGSLDDLAGAADRLLDDDSADVVITAELAEMFDDVSAMRAALGSELVPEVLPADRARTLRALDAGSAELFLRDRWLTRSGPHALLRAARVTPAGATLAVSVRPGGLTNTVRRIRVHLRIGTTHMDRDIAVFAQYARQWSLEIAAGWFGPLPDHSDDWQCDVELESADGRIEMLAVRRIVSRAGGLDAYPDLPPVPGATV